MNCSNAGRACSRALASVSATCTWAENPYFGCASWLLNRRASAACRAYSARYWWIIAAVWSKFADSATENAVFRPCAATQGMDSLFDVGYHIGGYGRWTGRSRLMTWSKSKYVPG